MNIVKSGFVNGKQRYSIINDGDIIKSSYDKHKLQDYLNPPIEPVCNTFEEEDTILDLDKLEDDNIWHGIELNLNKTITVLSNTKDEIRLSVPENERISIFPIGDLHIGSEQFNEDCLDYCFSVIAKSKKYVII